MPKLAPRSNFRAFWRNLIFAIFLAHFWAKSLENELKSAFLKKCWKFDFRNFYFKVFICKSLLPICHACSVSPPPSAGGTILALLRAKFWIRWESLFLSILLFFATKLQFENCSTWKYWKITLKCIFRGHECFRSTLWLLQNTLHTFIDHFGSIFCEIKKFEI